MGRIAGTLLVIVIVAGCRPGPPAGEAGKQGSPEPGENSQVEEEARAKPETVSFEIESMTQEVGSRLSQALAETEGVISARVDEEKGLYEVTFEPAKTGPEALLETLTRVAPSIRMEGVEKAGQEASPVPHDCGGCPMRNTCSGEHEPP